MFRSSTRFLLSTVSALALALTCTGMRDSFADVVQRPITRALDIAQGNAEGSMAVPINADLVTPTDFAAATMAAKLAEARAFVPTKRLDMVVDHIVKNSKLTRAQARPLASHIIALDDRMRALTGTHEPVATTGDIVPPDPIEGQFVSRPLGRPDHIAGGRIAFADGASLDWVKAADVRRFKTPDVEVPADTLHADTALTDL